MKIGLVCPYNVAKGGGVQEHIFATQNELLRRGHKVYIITPQPKEAPSKKLKNVIYVGGAANFNSPLKTTIQVSAGVNESIDAILDKYNFDILHFHEPWVPMLSAQILSRSNAVNVATFHAKLPETIMTRTMIKVVTPYTKSVLKYIHEFTAVSNAAAEYLRSLSDRHIELIPNGIDLSQFTPAEHKEKKTGMKTIFYVGRLEPRKGVKHLLYAYQILKKHDQNVRLVIAGDGPSRQKLEELAENLELTDIQFLGYVSEKDKIKYLRESDIYCSPALFGESFGIVLLEAMSTGTVTVAGDNPGYSSVLKGLGAVSLVNPKYHTEFARRLELLLHEESLRKLWRKWAKNELPQYSYTNIVDKYEKLYKTALAKHAAK